MLTSIDHLEQKFQRYSRQFPQEQALIHEYIALLSDFSPNPFTREQTAGHFTASAWVVSQDKQRVLLTHHKKLGRWLQLGGHADGEIDLAQVALKEAQEESGLSDLVLMDSEPFFLDKHQIPDYKTTPSHWHFDVCYVIYAGINETFSISEESLDLAWREISEIALDSSLDHALRNMAVRWINYKNYREI